jgi:hypothetical protein
MSHYVAEAATLGSPVVTIRTALFDHGMSMHRTEPVGIFEDTTAQHGS